MHEWACRANLGGKLLNEMVPNVEHKVYISIPRRDRAEASLHARRLPGQREGRPEGADARGKAGSRCSLRREIEKAKVSFRAVRCQYAR